MRKKKHEKKLKNEKLQFFKNFRKISSYVLVFLLCLPHFGRQKKFAFQSKANYLPYFENLDNFPTKIVEQPNISSNFY